MSLSQKAGIVILLFLVSATSEGQDHPDTLEQIGRYRQLSDQWQQKSMDSSLYYNRLAQQLARSIANDTVTADILLLGSGQWTKAGNMDSAKAYVEEATELFRRSGNKEQLHRAFYHKAYHYYYQRRFDSSLYYFTKVYHFYQKQGDVSKFAPTAMGIGTHFYYFKKDYEQALPYFYESARAYQQEPRPEGVAGAYLFAGLAHKKLERLDSAEYYIRLSLDITQQNGLEAKQLESLSYLGDILLQKGMRLEAFRYMREALALAQKTGAKMQEARMLGSLAAFVMDTAQYEEALEQEVQLFLKDYGGKGPFLVFSEDYVLQYAMPANQAQLLNYLSSYYADQKDYPQALAYFKRYHALQDSLNQQVNAQAIAEAEEKFETAQKEKELLEAESQMALLKRDKELQRTYYGSAVLALLLLGFIALIYARLHKVRAQREAKSRKLAEATALAESIERERIQEKLDHQKRELTAQALGLMRHNEFIGRIKNEIVENGEADLKDLKHLLRDNRLQEKDWAQFDTSFGELHPSFVQDLLRSNPKLTSGELRLAALIKLGMNNREIASLLHINSSSIHQAKYRLKKKIGLDAEQGLESFLLQLS